MNMAFTSGWHETNHRLLNIMLTRVRQRLESYAAGSFTPEHAASGNGEAEANDAIAPALDHLCSLFGLSGFERDVLLLCAGVELDSRVASLCATLAGDPQYRAASFGIALGALEGAHWSALAPEAPLRRWRLVELAGNQPLTSGALRIDEYILHYIAGVATSDARLHGLLTPCDATNTLTPSQQELAGQLAGLWRQDRAGARAGITQLHGGDAIAILSVAAAAAVMAGLRLIRMRVDDIPQTPGERAALARLCDRRLALEEAALFVECAAHVSSEMVERTVVPFVESMVSPLVLGARDNLACKGIGRRFEVPAPTRAERRGMLRGLVNGHAASLDPLTEDHLVEFSIDETLIRRTLVECDGAGEDLAERLRTVCREQARPSLDDLARRIEPAASWDDLVLPDAQRATLHDIALHVRQSATVYESWGFANKSSRGLGVAALFAGASGTGKTMAAEVLARELRLDLYHIDLSRVVSKYIGETEKHLRRIFDAAEQACAILLFDEADALFGKRSEVKDSHDRYANIEVSYLLQRMEAYRGLAILTTNMKSALDPAFLRRLRFVVQFPFPDTAQRAEIWRRVFPRETPTHGLDAERLAQLNLAGGNIRNIALNAAFLAAGAGTPVRMSHLKSAAQSEYAKLERPLAASELGGWE